MKILVLNGSPRHNGNTAKLIDAFNRGAIEKGHQVNIVDVCDKDIHGCTGCEYCHTKGKGTCIQKDDMSEIYDNLKSSEMLVLASPIYYHGLSGQLKCAIDRFYAVAYPVKPPLLKKIALVVSSGAGNVYDGVIYAYQQNFITYSGLENIGIITSAGDLTDSSLDVKRAYELGLLLI